MAKILFSAVVGDVRNKIGGTVFSKARFGAYVRRKVSPVQPRTSAQRNVRSSFTGIAKLWGSAGMATFRAGWRALAGSYPRKDVFGQSVYLTGLQLFEACNRALNTIGLPPILDTPTELVAGSPDGCTVTYTGTPKKLEAVGITPPGAKDVPAVHGAPPLSPGREYIGTKFVFLKKGTAGSGTAIDVTAEYEARFGAIIAGQRIFLQLVYINNETGAMGARAQGSVVAS